MQLMIDHANLTDAWAATHPQPPFSPPRRNEIGAAARAIDLWGMTAWSMTKGYPYQMLRKTSYQ